jgi:hypothetical protein
MLKHSKLIITVIICLSSIISGCVTLGALSPRQSGTYSLKVPDLGDKPDILGIAEEVGKELGYKVLAKSPNFISFKHQTNLVVSMASGSICIYIITVMKGEIGRAHV